MKSDEVEDHGGSEQVLGQAKKLWVTPSLDIIALKSAESGRGTKAEAHGALFIRTS